MVSNYGRNNFHLFPLFRRSFIVRIFVDVIFAVERPTTITSSDSFVQFGDSQNVMSHLHLRALHMCACLLSIHTLTHSDSITIQFWKMPITSFWLDFVITVCFCLCNVCVRCVTMFFRCSSLSCNEKMSSALHLSISCCRQCHHISCMQLSLV